jgi:hypothetical protein
MAGKSNIRFRLEIFLLFYFQICFLLSVAVLSAQGRPYDEPLQRFARQSQPGLSAIKLFFSCLRENKLRVFVPGNPSEAPCRCSTLG